MTFCVFTCFSFNNNGLPRSCGTSAQGAQKDTRACQVGGNEERMEPEDIRLLTSKTSQEIVVKCGENSERSKHTYKTNDNTRDWNLHSPAQQAQRLLTFFQHLNGQMSWLDMARSKSRKKATAKMRFEGQVTGNVNLLDQTMTSKSKPKIP